MDAIHTSNGLTKQWGAQFINNLIQSLNGTEGSIYEYNRNSSKMCVKCHFFLYKDTENIAKEVEIELKC